MTFPSQGQTAYPAAPNVGVPGDPAYANDMETKEETYTNVSNPIPFGRMVAKVAGTTDRADFGTSEEVQWVGITRRSLQTTSGQYDLNSAMAVFSFGQVYVSPEQDVTPDDPVFVRTVGKKQVQTIVFSGNLITGNSVAGVVNGTNLTATAFDTDNATTLTDLATKIAAQPHINSATSDGSHTITVTSDQDQTVTLSGFTVTGGASQATSTITETTTAIFTSALGSFRKDSDSGNAVLMEGCRYRTATTDYAQNDQKLCIVDIISPLNPVNEFPGA